MILHQWSQRCGVRWCCGHGGFLLALAARDTFCPDRSSRELAEMPEFEEFLNLLPKYLLLWKPC